MIKKIILGFGILSLVITPTAFAQSPTPKDQVTQQVQEQLDSIKNAATLVKRSFAGTVTAIEDITVSLTSLVSTSKKILVPTDATIKLSSGKEGTIKDLKVKDFLIAMGNMDTASGTLTARRIVVVSPTAADTRQTLQGTVTKTSTSSLTLDSAGTSLTLRITSESKFSSASKVTAAKDIKEGHLVTAIAKPSSTGTTTFTASRLFVLATQSPTPTIKTTVSPSPQSATPTP